MSDRLRKQIEEILEEFNKIKNKTKPDENDILRSQVLDSELDRICTSNNLKRSQLKTRYQNNIKLIDKL